MEQSNAILICPSVVMQCYFLQSGTTTLFSSNSNIQPFISSRVQKMIYALKLGISKGKKGKILGIKEIQSAKFITIKKF